MTGTTCTAMPAVWAGLGGTGSLSARGGRIQPDKGTGRAGLAGTGQDGRKDTWCEGAIGRRVEIIQSFLRVFVKHILYARLCSKPWEHSKRDQKPNQIPELTFSWEGHPEVGGLALLK